MVRTYEAVSRYPLSTFSIPVLPPTVPHVNTTFPKWLTASLTGLYIACSSIRNHAQLAYLGGSPTWGKVALFGQSVILYCRRAAMSIQHTLPPLLSARAFLEPNLFIFFDNWSYTSTSLSCESFRKSFLCFVVMQSSPVRRCSYFSYTRDAGTRINRTAAPVLPRRRYDVLLFTDFSEVFPLAADMIAFLVLFYNVSFGRGRR